MFSPEHLSKIMRLDWEKDKIVPFSPYHLDLCALNPFDKKMLRDIPDFKKRIEALSENSYAFTAMSEGEIYAMFGVYPMWKGVAEAWLIPSAIVNRRTITFHRASLVFFDYAMAKLELKRLQFTVHSANVPADMWAKRCYFEFEGKLKFYGPDKANYKMYARYS